MNLYRLVLRKDDLELRILYCTSTYSIMKVVEEAYGVAGKLNAKLTRVDEVRNEKTETMMKGRFEE